MGGTLGLGITVQGSEGGASGGTPDTTGWLWRKQGGVNGQYDCLFDVLDGV